MTDLEKNAYMLIRRGCACSRADLARRLGVSRPTASTVAKGLLARGLIRECGKGKSTGGTTPILLSAETGLPGCVGIDLGYADRMSAVLLDSAGNILEKKECEFDPMDLSSMAVNSKKMVRTLSSGKKLVGVAVALSAIIDETTGRVINSINPALRSNQLQSMLKETLEYPVFSTNRSRAAAFSEAFGGAADQMDFALISLGRSIGAAFWCGGKLFCGSGSAAGEIRNLRVASGVRLEQALSPERTSGADREAILEICADAMSQIIDIIDLNMLILSGRFADFGRDFSVLLEKRLRETGTPATVRAAQFGRFSAARGCALRMGELIIPNTQTGNFAVPARRPRQGPGTI